MRKEYEELSGEPWPTEADGKPYPGHHVDPIQDVGSNPVDPNNVIPVPTEKHKEIHQAYRQCSEKFKDAGPHWPYTPKW